MKQPAVPASPVEVDGTGDVTLNFVNADIREVIRLVLGTTLNLNYVVDPQVQGVTTLQTSRPMSRDDLLLTLEVVLRQNGAALVESDGLYRVVPTANAARPLDIGRSSRSAADGFRITAVPLAYVAAAEMQEILTPLTDEGTILYADHTRNLLILGGSGHELTAMLQTIEAFDIDWLSGMSFGMFRLDYVDANTMIGELQSLLLDRQDEPLSNLLRLVPIERLNAVLAISTQQRYVDAVQTWIDRLDVAGDSLTRQVFVYSVQNGRATDLAEVLNELFGAEQPVLAVAAEPTLAPNLAPFEMLRPANSAMTLASDAVGPEEIGITSEPALIDDLLNDLEASPEPLSPPLPADPAASAEGAGTGVALSQQSPVRIVADDKRNALLIWGTTRDYRNILSLLRTLDAEPLQVLIEATIAEVTLRDELRYGLQWFFQTGNSEFTLSNASSGAVAPAFPGFAYTFLTQDVRIVLDALSDLTDLNVISSPQLMVLNNEIATLQVGDQVPIPVASAVSVDDPDAVVVNTIVFRDTGVVLSVVPRVNENGMVTLEIEQEVSEAVQTVSSGIDAPTIAQRKVSSVVAVPSGATIALAGLIRDSRSLTKSGIPGISRVPVVGALFGSTAEVESRTELLILLTPRVVRNLSELLAVTDELRRRVRAVEPLGERVL